VSCFIFLVTPQIYNVFILKTNLFLFNLNKISRFATTKNIEIMKTKITLLIFNIVCVLGLNAQENIGLSMGASYAYDIYYSLENGITASTERTNWELAFSTNAYETNIRINSGNSVALYQVSTDLSEWNTITSLSSNSVQLRNSNTDWAQGAFVVNKTGNLNYGWGDYNTETHIIEGSRIYILTYGSSTKKMRINSLQMGLYNFTIANLDGSSEQEINLNVNSYNNKKFIYYSLQNMEVIDREPPSTSWDLLFTKYEEDLNNDIADPLNYEQPYNVTGVLSNDNLIAQYEGSISDNLSILAQDTTRNINTIGFDWKQYSGSYVMAADRSYFIADQNEEQVYKIIFNSFAGQSSGNLSFELIQVEELLSEEEYINSALVNVFPNPSSGAFYLEYNPSSPVKVTVTNFRGQTISSQIISEPTWIDLSDQAQGFYFIQLNGKEINTVKKVSVIK
tara:strand:- start:2639 stop:3991 length:1353 start_codon:yes stop_codon:yes gene_type:complete